MHTIRNPIEWGWTQLRHAARTAETAAHAADNVVWRPAPTIRSLSLADLREVLARGLADMGAYRSDLVFLVVIYPFIGLILSRLAFGYDMLPLLFPLASGFALVGPIAAVGLYELSRRRELGYPPSWKDAFAVVHSPSLGAIVILSLILLGLFLAWIGTAYSIYAFTLGPQAPASLETFLHDVLTTPGWTLIVVGIGTGFVFALAAMMVSVVSFPLLVDNPVTLRTAIGTSIRAVLANPVPMAAWGMIVAGALVIGTIPAFIGLIVVIPLLGHATWHLYRQVIAP